MGSTLEAVSLKSLEIIAYPRELFFCSCDEMKHKYGEEFSLLQRKSENIAKMCSSVVAGYGFKAAKSLDDGS